MNDDELVLEPDDLDLRDTFQTPNEAILPLNGFIAQDAFIWEPSCGNGNIVRFFEETGRRIVGTDIVHPIHEYRHDFLRYTLPNFSDVDVIVTNPPYSKSVAFVQRCIQLGKPFALLMPIQYLGGQDRQGMWASLTHGFKDELEIIMLGRRINFETPTGKDQSSGSSAMFETAWFTRGLKISQRTRGLNLPRFSGLFLQAPRPSTSENDGQIAIDGLL